MRRAPAQRGAALLLAMMILTLVATLASGMVWQQSRSIQVEAAERARVQSAWILNGALDWARLILREDARSGGADHLGEPWATPLAEARLSTFLAADRDNNADSQASWTRTATTASRPVLIPVSTSTGVIRVDGNGVQWARVRNQSGNNRTGTNSPARKPDATM